MKNKISIVGLLDERSLWEEEIESTLLPYGNANGSGANNTSSSNNPQDFVLLAEAQHGYPPTKIAWQPASASKMNGTYSNDPSGMPRELLASSADGLRIWEYTQNAEAIMNNQFVGRSTPGPLSGRIQLRVLLTGVSRANFKLYMQIYGKVYDNPIFSYSKPKVKLIRNWHPSHLLLGTASTPSES
jgi:WD repeat-containing protein 68